MLLLWRRGSLGTASKTAPQLARRARPRGFLAVWRAQQRIRADAKTRRHLRHCIGTQMQPARAPNNAITRCETAKLVGQLQLASGPRFSRAD